VENRKTAKNVSGSASSDMSAAYEEEAGWGDIIPASL
jgi:hypothetical protein